MKKPHMMHPGKNLGVFLHKPNAQKLSQEVTQGKLMHSAHKGSTAGMGKQKLHRGGKKHHAPSY